MLIDFKNIETVGTEVFLEVQDGTTNLHKLKKGIKAPVAKADDKEPLKVIVRRLVTNGAELHPSVTLIAQQDLKPISVSPVLITGVGEKENGILPGAAAGQIMQMLLQTYAKEAAEAGFYQGLSPEALQEMGVHQLDHIKGQLLDEVDKIGDGLKKLFQ